MKAWTETLTLAALAVLFTLTLAGCAEDGPTSMAEAEPETFDAATVYEIVPVGGTPSLPGEQAIFVQFDSEEAKRGFADTLDARFQLEPLPTRRATQVWDNERPVYVLGAAAEGNWRLIRAVNYPQRTLLEKYGPERREVPR